MNLEELKSFLRIDYDDDDTILNLIIEAARLWVKGAVGKCDEEDARVRLLLMGICQELYQNRTYTIAGNTEDKIRYFNRAILLQLEAEAYVDESESGRDE